MSEKYFPVLVGREDKRKIFIEYGEYLKIIKFAKAGASDGARGVLLGKKTCDGIYILKALEALYTGDEGLEAPSFTMESWSRIMAEIKENYCDLEVIGQYASHSPYAPNRSDYIMQEKFFSSEQDMLFLFDPVKNVDRFYFYSGREYVFVDGFYLFDKYENPIDLKLREAVTRPLEREYEIRMKMFEKMKQRIKKQNNFYAVIAIILLVFLIYNLIHLFELEQRIDGFYGENTEWNREFMSSEN